MTDDLESAFHHFLEARADAAKWRAIGSAEKDLTVELRKAFQKQAAEFLRRFEVLADKFPGETVEEAAPDPFVDDEDWEPIWKRVAEKTKGFFDKPLVKFVGGVLAAGYLAQLSLTPDKYVIGMSFDLKFPWAADYIKEHGADLVTRIDETTKEQMRTIIHQAVDEGWSYNRTAQEMKDKFKDYYSPKDAQWAFDAKRPQEHIKDRASMIAVTETGNAYEEGSKQVVQGLADRGLTVMKSWYASGDEKDCEICDDNAAEGWIPLDQPHKSGDMHPLGHPGCRCDELYEVKT